jgi:hypothetical protein
MFTFDITGHGTCDSNGCMGTVDPYATPAGYFLVGFWHNHPGGSFPRSSGEDRRTATVWTVPIITGTKSHVLIYVPESGCFNGDAVLSGGYLPGACHYTYNVH